MAEQRGTMNGLLQDLQRAASSSERLAMIHRGIKVEFPAVDRISVALYDDKTDLLKSFLQSSDAGNPIDHYQFLLAEMPSLQEVAQTGRPRLINDLDSLRDSEKPHCQMILASGYRSSYTVPMFWSGQLKGFVFYNHCRKNGFLDERLGTLDLFAYLIGHLVMGEIAQVQTLSTVLKVVSGFVHRRPPKVGFQQERIAHYTRLIARQLVASGRYELSDEYIEQLFNYARLYDMGKLGVSGQVLRKPAKLDYDERREVQKHPLKGRELIDALLSNLETTFYLREDLLRHVTEHHHETMDGHGYPDRLKGDQIALEARIVAVADIFDALTSWRPYHRTWTNELAFAMLRLLANNKLDADCVRALIDNEEAVKEIQLRFKDEESEGFAKVELGD